MRNTALMGALAATAALYCAAALAGSADLPKRKPGHWEIVTVSQATGMTTIQACVGPDDSIAAIGAGCSEPKVTPAGSEIIVDVVCTTEAGKQTMSTVFGGDFSTRYRAVMKMSFDPPPANAAATLGVTIDGKYIGPDCPPASDPGAAK